jgi:hypothetical protein
LLALVIGEDEGTEFYLDEGKADAIIPSPDAE